MEIRFISHIRASNQNGTGFFYIPKDKAGSLGPGDWVRVQASNDIYFFAKTIFYSNQIGIYVPKKIVQNNNLLNNKIEIRLQRINGFYASVSLDGRLYIPQAVAEVQKLKRNDVVLVKAIKDDKIIREKYSKIHITFRGREGRSEYTCVFDKYFHGKEYIFTIEKQTAEVNIEKLNPIIISALKNTHYAFIGGDSVIAFSGNKMPIIINSNIKYCDIAFYLGAYFADGTKKGNSWAICASTFDQARAYLKMHNFLIKDSSPEFIISYTNIYKINPEEVKKELVKIWEDKIGIRVNKTRIREPIGKSPGKWNKYGTLIIREHRIALLDFYNSLLGSLLKEILFNKDKRLAIDFICGVLEGDGYAPATKRGHITISTNKNEATILENILDAVQIKFKIYKEHQNSYFLRIGALEILRNFHFLKDKIFILYPERHKAFFERLKTVGGVRFFIEGHEPTGWVKAWLKENGFLNAEYDTTEKGEELGKNLKNATSL
ncbi:hypothetical protein KJ591_01380 [Patescibacteria group bacterium]|nr:hypothetical protein [Patescibacteria group bacterium]MBU4022997.1 hypothetical protein [Patescibacteria group bacterium]MBU4162316.1 hypothetical protein [Patescibacteria group bacterium]